MPKVYFMSQGRGPGSDPDLLAGPVDVESVPRVGERVMLTGPAFGQYKSDHSSFFLVEDVLYQIAVPISTISTQEESIEEEIPNVFLREEGACFVPKCTCTDRNTEETPSHICSNCSGRIV